MSYFEKNILALAQYNQALHEKLSSFGDVESFEIFMDEGDIATLNFVNTKNFTPLYEGSPKETVAQQATQYQLFAKYPYLYFYGLGNGVLIKELLKNEIHRRIMVIEPELEILYVVLHMIDFTEEIESGRLVLLGFEETDFPTLIGYFLLYKEHKWAKTYSLEINAPYYDKLFAEHMQHTNKVIIEALYHSVNIAGNDTVDSLIGLKHHIANLSTVMETPPLHEMLKKLHSCDTAVLVSTGPSLTKQLPLLKKIAPHVRIVAVDASFPVLYQAGIKPDLVVSIERVKESARFFTDMPQEAFEDVVFALSSVQHRDVVKSIKGGTLQMSLRPLGLMMYTGPEHWGYVGLGQSAANMAYEIVYHSGFKNCILIGQDLAYSADGKSHASGHVFGEENVKTKDKDTWVKGWQGKGEVRTNHTWDMFRRSFEKDIGDTKATMLTINATEGGASIYGTLEIGFEEAIQKCIDKKYQKSPLKLMRAVTKERERIAKDTWQKVLDMEEYVVTLLEVSKTLFLDVAEATERQHNQVPNELLESLVSRAEAIKAKYEEEIYDKVVWHIAQTTMLSKEIELAPAEVFVAQNEEQARDRLWHLVEAYKPWLFLFSGILDSILRTIAFAKARRLIDEIEVIDVYAGDKKIDSFTTKELQPELGRVFDVDMRGILYDVPDAYQTQLNAVAFRDANSGDELPRAFVDIIKRDDAKYNELSFMKSLEEPIDEESIKDMYTPNVIGFLATEENLEDEEFVGYINELMKRFPDIEVKGFCYESKFLDIQKYFVKQVTILLINEVQTMIKSLGIFLFLNKRKACKRVATVLGQRSSHIYSVSLNSSFKNITLLEYAQLSKSHKVWTLYKELGLSDEQKKQSNGIFHIFLYQNIYNQLKLPYKIDINENLFEYEYFIKIEHILKYPGFKQKVSTTLNLLKGLS